jgi:chromate transporter
VVAVAVVAQAVWGMARALCPDRERAGIAVAAALVVIFVAGSLGQVAAIVMGALAGLWLCRGAAAMTTGRLVCPVSRRAGAVALALFLVLLVLLPVAAAAYPAQALALLDAFYRAGALVFGGGHVVLPLLQAEVVRPGWVSEDAFLAGYGAAQAVPGPLFTFAAYLGAVMRPEPDGVVGAAICLIAVFVPGLLLVVGALPFWDTLRTRPGAQAALRGTNAAVVGLLGAALYHPVWTSAILSPRDFALALVGFVLLTAWQAPPWLVVALTAAGGVALSFL